MQDYSTAFEYYSQLRKYLSSYLKQLKANVAASTQRANAREKLTKLTKQQFNELSTDVYDEMTRRLDAQSPPFLAVSTSFHPKRNQARQKLATLPNSRFKDLASDVYYEIERRFPQVAEDFLTQYGPDDISFDNSRSFDESQKDHVRYREPSLTSMNNNSFQERRSISKSSQKDLSADESILNDAPTPVQRSPPKKDTKNENLNGINVAYIPLPAPTQSPIVSSKSEDKTPDSTKLESSNSSRQKQISNIPSKSGKQPVHTPLSRNADSSQLNFSALDNLMTDLGQMLSTSKEGIAEGSISRKDTIKSNTDSSHKTSALETQLQAIEKTRKDLVHELDSAKTKWAAENESLSKKLSTTEKELDIKKKEFVALQNALSSLKDDHTKLEAELKNQQSVTKDVRAEATNLLKEIKELTDKNKNLEDAHIRDQQLIKELQANLAANVRPPSGASSSAYEGQRDSIRRGSNQRENSIPSNPTTSTRNQYPDILGRASLSSYGIGETYIGEGNGLLSKSRYTAYETAMENLLQAARGQTNTNILVAMKNIVVVCKNITEDAEVFEDERSDDDELTDELGEMKNSLSASLTTLMTAAKNQATNMNDSNLDVLEVAAQKLTSTVSDLIRLIRSRSTATSMTNVHRTFTGQSRGSSIYPHPEESPRKSSIQSIDRRRSSSSTAQGINKIGENSKESSYNGYKTIQELKQFLEIETDKIVTAIQTLLQAMKHETTTGDDYVSTVNGIITIVDHIIAITEGTLEEPAGHPYKKEGFYIVEELGKANIRLDTLGESIHENPNSKTLKQKLASSSYDIAKYVKELISLLE